MVVYHTVVHQTRQNEAVQYLAKTFAGSSLEIKRSTFPLGRLHLYIFVNVNMKVIKSRFTVEELNVGPNVIELAAMQDIPTIPVMHPAIQASME